MRRASVSLTLEVMTIVWIKGRDMKCSKRYYKLYYFTRDKKAGKKNIVMKTFLKLNLFLEKRPKNWYHTQS